MVICTCPIKGYTMKKYFYTISLLVLLAGCGSSSGAFTESDMCVEQVNDSSSKVCYGMSKSEVEKILGPGQEVHSQLSEFENGLSAMYRDDMLVAIVLKEESKGVYVTARGAGMGMSKSEIVKLYKDFSLFWSEGSVTSAYDMVEEEFIGEDYIENKEQADKVLMLAVVFDSAETANRILLGDRLIMMYLE